MAFAVSGHLPQMRELLAALNLDKCAVSHLVLDFPVGGPARCFAVTYPETALFNPLVKFVRAIAVDERGAITAEPLSLTDNAKMLARAVLADEIDLVATRALADEIIAECTK